MMWGFCLVGVRGGEGFGWLVGGFGGLFILRET